MQDVWDSNISGDISIVRSPAETESTRRKLGQTFRGSHITSLSLIGVWGLEDNLCASAKSLHSFYSDTPAIGQRVFDGCTALTTVNLPMANVTYWGYSTRQDYCFTGCTALKNVNLPLYPQVGNNMFSKCYALEQLDLPSCHTIDISGFYDCRTLTSLVLRRSTSVVTLKNVNAFNNTPFRGYGGYSGHIYVPSDLIEEYQAATNWSTLYANYPDLFAPIEGSPYENA